MFWFVVLLLLAGAGFYFYQKMMAIEEEIRSEQAAAEDAPSSESTAAPEVTSTPLQQEQKEEPSDNQDEAATSDNPIVTPEVEKMTSKAAPVEDADLSLEDEILAAVKNLPGVKQTELYSSFSDVSKKHLQQIFKDLADDGKLKREKKGNSYLLYPA